MRFVKLVVEAFQGIGRAEIDFGPGLNILYGENDLGKSTLASAVRAALLMLPKSSDAERFVSWYADAAPVVELTFTDDDGRYWRVRKVFWRGASAELLHSKDGTHYTLDSKGREVEEKLREVLSWGIPSPGGKGAPRGLPASFLANTLLAAQTDVDAILKQSLAADSDDSGKLRLQKALATLAQDPLFKRVLDAAQSECDEYFTGTGKLRRTQGSKIVAANEEVKRHQREQAEFQELLAQSMGVEEQVAKLRMVRDEMLSAQANAEAAVAASQEGLTNGKIRSEVSAQLAVARVALAEIDTHAAQVARSAQELADLDASVALCEAECEAVLGEAEHSSADLRAAEEAYRVATAEHGEQARTVRRAEIETELAKLQSARSQLEARRDLARHAQAALRELNEANEATAATIREQERLAVELAQAYEAVKNAEAEVEQARAVLAYGRWHVLANRAAEASVAMQKAGELRRQAEVKRAEVRAIEEQGTSAEATLTAISTTLPTEAELELVVETQQALGLAEAALGGGLDLVVRPRRPIDVRVSVDQRATEHRADLRQDSRFEAERTLNLIIDELVEIEVRAGAADKRHRVEELRADWNLKCLPVLQRAGVNTSKALAEARASANKQGVALKELRARAESVRTEARVLDEHAELHAQQAARDTIDPSELSSKQEAIGGLAQEPLARAWANLKGNKEAEAERAQEQQRNACAHLHTAVNKLEQTAVVAAHSRASAEERARERERAVNATHAALGDAKPESVLQSVTLELERCLSQHAAGEKALAAIEAEASNARAGAQRALEQAQAAVEQTRIKSAAAQEALEKLRASANLKRGEYSAKAQQLGQMKREAAEAQVEACETAFHELPASPVATEADVAAAKATYERITRELEDINQEFFKAEGALSKVGGAQLRERLAQVSEALRLAKAREHEIEVDAQAWKLLRETLRHVENTEGAHLGRALGGPVGERFATLTRGRYVNLQFDPMLGAQTLQAAGVANETGVLGALSAGTRDQLATLVRLTIAHQLKSAIILDDHLVQTDSVRLAWFREMLMRTAVETQVVVFTCRPDDYLSRQELPTAANPHDLGGGSLRVINLGALVKRWAGAEGGVA